MGEIVRRIVKIKGTIEGNARYSYSVLEIPVKTDDIAAVNAVRSLNGEEVEIRIVVPLSDEEKRDRHIWNQTRRR